MKQDEGGLQLDGGVDDLDMGGDEDLRDGDQGAEDASAMGAYAGGASDEGTLPRHKWHPHTVKVRATREGGLCEHEEVAVVVRAKSVARGSCFLSFFVFKLMLLHCILVTAAEVCVLGANQF